MKAFTKLSTFILLAAVLAGCSKEDGEVPYLGPKFDNYVGKYIKPVELFGTHKYNFTTGEGGPALAEQEYNRFWMEMRFGPRADEPYGEEGKRFDAKQVEEFELKHFIHRTPKSTDYVIYDDPYNPEFNRIYDSLCVAHKDIGLLNTDYYRGHFSYPATFRKMTLDVLSDAPYDAAHPAGVSLADIITVKFYSAKEFIESGYIAPKPGTPEEEQWCLGDGMALTKSLAQFNTEYRKLVGGWFRFEFTKAPDATSTHRFTLVYRDEDGRELTTAMPPVTIKVAQ